MFKSKLRNTLLAATLMAGGLMMGTPAYATPGTVFIGNDSLLFDTTTADPTGGTFVNLSTSELEWVNESDQHSFLRILDPSGTDVAITSDSGLWVDIAQLEHENNVISVSSFSFTIDMLDSFQLDGATFAATGTDTIATTLGISFLETFNQTLAANCAGLNPVGSACDDTFTISGLDSVLGTFLFNDGTEDYSITFRILAEVDSGTFFDDAGNVIYTAEVDTSHIFIQAQINQVPEPGSLALLGIGLVGLLPIARRAKKTDAKKADAKKA